MILSVLHIVDVFTVTPNLIKSFACILLRYIPGKFRINLSRKSCSMSPRRLRRTMTVSLRPYIASAFEHFFIPVDGALRNRQLSRNFGNLHITGEMQPHNPPTKVSSIRSWHYTSKWLASKSKRLKIVRQPVWCRAHAHVLKFGSVVNLLTNLCTTRN